jgi:hypothetical protein
MKNIVLNTTRFFCPSGICAASDCRCPKVERVPYPTLREWWSDAEHRRITLYMALIAAVSIAVYVYGAWSR